MCVIPSVKMHIYIYICRCVYIYVKDGEPLFSFNRSYTLKVIIILSSKPGIFIQNDGGGLEVILIINVVVDVSLERWTSASRVEKDYVDNAKRDKYAAPQKGLSTREMDKYSWGRALCVAECTAESRRRG